jgi:hypothetical protein
MGGHGWAKVAADGYGVGMGTNSKENVGLCCTTHAQQKNVLPVNHIHFYRL